MAISVFKTSSLAQRLPKYKKMWSPSVGKVGTWGAYSFPSSADVRQIVSNGTTRAVGCSYSDSVWWYTADGITWTTIPTKPLGALSVCWTGSQFAAVDYANTTWTQSVDGTTWLSGSLSGTTPASVAGIAYGNSVYVLGGRGGTPSYSSDGKAWTAASGASTSDPRFTFGNGIFMMVEANSSTSYWTSTNGSTWTSRTCPSSASLGFASFANGKFFFHSSTASTTTYYYSTDAINWTAGTLPASQVWVGVAYANGVYVAVGTGGSATSYDGITWSSLSGPSISASTGWQPVVLSNSILAANGSGGSTGAKYLPITLG